MTISVPIVGFFFVCIVMPQLVKHKAQFYMAFAVLILILLLDIVADVTGGASVGFVKLLYVTRGVCWIVDLVLLVLATGGLSMHQLTGEFKNAYEVMRRGEDKPTLIVPKRDNPYVKPQEQSPIAVEPEPPQPPAATPTATSTEPGDRTIPLE
jgi:hypothetical protein